MHQERSPTPSAAGLARPIAFVTIGAIAVGILTSVGQGTLPFEMSSLANSAGSWSLAAFLLCLCNAAPRRGLVLGFQALAAMLAGYVVATELRGYATGSAMWLFLGHGRDRRGACPRGRGGVGPRDRPEPDRCRRGRDRRDPRRRRRPRADPNCRHDIVRLLAVQITIGLAIVVVSVVRLRRPGPSALCALLTASIAALFYGVYSVI